MGAHCCKWCCKPCRKRVDVTDKVRELFRFSASESAEHHAAQRGNKLCSYLRDRFDQVSKCGKLIDDQTKTILDQEVWSQMDTDTIKVALIVLKLLTAQFPQHFMPQAYLISYRLVSGEHFSRVKQLAYDLVAQCTKSAQLETSAASDQFLQELVQYCEANSNLIGREEFALLGLLISAHPLSYELNVAEPQQRKWTQLLELVLKHLLTDLTLETGALVEEEKQLLQTLFDATVCNVETTNYLCNTLLQFIQGNAAWGSFSDLVLDLLFETIASGKSDYLSEMFKTFVFFLHSVVADTHCNPVYVKAFVRKLIACLEHSRGSVPTLTYNSVSAIQTLQEVFLGCISRTDLKATGIDLLSAWCNKTDQQSFLKMMHQLVIDERADHNYDVCLTYMKRHLQKRIELGARDGLFDDLNKEMSQLVMLMLEAMPSSLVLKVPATQTLAFLARILRGRLKLRPLDAHSMHRALINQLSVITNELTYQSMKMCKYCSQIWLCVAALASTSHLEGLVHLVFEVEKLGRKTTSPPMQLTLLVVLLVHVHALGAFYNEKKLTDLADRAAKAMLPRELYPKLFEKERWDLVCSFQLRLFRKAQYTLFERHQAAVQFSSLQLPDVLKDVFPQMSEPKEEDESAWRNSVDPLDTVYSESSISSQYSDVGRPVDVSDIRPEVVTGAAAVARHEEEQQQLLQRLAGKS